jgi:hypothetical protein
MKIRDFEEHELDLTVWRYMPFTKFISLITYQALWFSKLNILQDKFEGKMPKATSEELNKENQKYKKQFNTPEFHRQIDNWNQENEESGRELLVVNCWFVDENESKGMWQEYGVNNESVAIKSTVRKLTKSVFLPPNETITSQIGMVSYVDHDTHKISNYEANQAIERVFLKDKSFKHEQELRLATMSFKTVCCVAMNGVPYTPDEVAGKNMNNYDNAGLYIKTNLKNLISEVVTHPDSGEWFYLLVCRIVELCGIEGIVTKSRIKA